jgi:hypothetical protein
MISRIIVVTAHPKAEKAARVTNCSAKVIIPLELL